MSVVADLKRIRYLLTELAKRPDCAQVASYDSTAIKLFIEGLSRAIARYEKEARRVRKYYH